MPEQPRLPSRLNKGVVDYGCAVFTVAWFISTVCLLAAVSGRSFLRLRDTSLSGPAALHGFGQFPPARAAQSCFLCCCLLCLRPGSFCRPTSLHRKREPPSALRSHTAFSGR